MTNLSLELLDDFVLQDFKNFVQRAKQIDNGAIRLYAVGKTLVAYVPVQYAKNILDNTATVLAVRVMALAKQTNDLDVVVPLGALSERFARMLEHADLSKMRLNLVVPPTRLQVSWVGISPPRKGWVFLDRVLVSFDDIHTLDIKVHPSFPFVAKTALQKLGFLEKDVTKVDIYQNSRWFRLSTVYGHIMVRL